MYSTKESSNSSINKLKEDVTKYITMAKTQYNINVDEIYEVLTSEIIRKGSPRNQLKLRLKTLKQNLEPPYKNISSLIMTAYLTLHCQVKKSIALKINLHT